MMTDNLISQQIATELKVQPKQVQSVIQLMSEGATVPFIARYRKEVTGGLDDTQLRDLDQRLTYLRELESRKQTILKSIQDQGKLTDDLQQAIQKTLNKTELEDIYLPYKPKRRTRGQIAIEAGLEPLAEMLWSTPQTDPEIAAAAFIDAEKGVADSKAALDGARAILMERFADDAALLAKVRDYLWRNAHLVSRVVSGKEVEGEKFQDYFEYSELISKIPSHRALALFRGRNEGFLQLTLNPDPLSDEPPKISHCEEMVRAHLGVILGDQPADRWRQSVVSWTWKVKVALHLETELMSTLRERAETEAIDVFAANLQDMLMAPPAGMKVTLGMDPGLRTGVKLAVVDETGKLLATDTIYPHTQPKQYDEAIRTVTRLCQVHQVALVAIGNGTGSRETERFFQDVLRRSPELTAEKVIVSEAGASVYSASELAANEFPDLDVSLRGAVSIARRLQDPLAELVKIDPKSIGVGQYQHDVSQHQLAKKLDHVVEDCVNRVGVDLNTASVMLLSRIAGLSQTLAKNIVEYRDQQGQFRNREQLLNVARLGPKAFEQCAGFLRIANGDNPLDASAVHPEAYPVVHRILAQIDQPLKTVMGNGALLNTLKPSDFTDDHFGVPTVSDIISELEKPGRDPRPEFKTAQFDQNISEISDLTVGLILEGTVTNVANFGAFVDIGVHQDGLIHISALSDQFVDNPRSVVKTGDIVKVQVVSVDVARRRIGLSMRLQKEISEDNTSSDRKKTAASRDSAGSKTSSKASKPAPINNSIMGNAFADAFKKGRH